MIFDEEVCDNIAKWKEILVRSFSWTEISLKNRGKMDPWKNTLGVPKNQEAILGKSSKSQDLSNKSCKTPSNQMTLIST
jgi:hypothetical protein